MQGVSKQGHNQGADLSIVFSDLAGHRSPPASSTEGAPLLRSVYGNCFAMGFSKDDGGSEAVVSADFRNYLQEGQVMVDDGGGWVLRKGH